MSIHSSLRKGQAAAGHRNVLTRIERIAKLEEQSLWSEDQNTLQGLPKVRSIKVAMKKKKKEKKEEEGAEAGAAAK